MKIDILSDLHVDFYFKKKPTEKIIHDLYGNILGDNTGHKVITGKGDVLVVAGDIGHYNRQNIEVLKLIKKVFEYKHIICVLGNHDYYLVSNAAKKTYNHRSSVRTERMRELINNEEGMYCLDGNIVEIDGIRFGGCDGWYDGAYIRKHFWKKSEEYMDGYVSLLWRRTMADAAYLYVMDWQAYAKEECKKLEHIYRDVDVMITHINPSIEKEHTDRMYRNEDTTGYFTFEGSKFLKGGSMKYWVFGHTHSRAEYEKDDVMCVCNPMGYPNESANGRAIMPMQIEI